MKVGNRIFDGIQQNSGERASDTRTENFREQNQIEVDWNIVCFDEITRQKSVQFEKIRIDQFKTETEQRREEPSRR